MRAAAKIQLTVNSENNRYRNVQFPTSTKIMMDFYFIYKVTFRVKAFTF